MKSILSALGILSLGVLFGTAGCGKKTESTEGVKQGVLKYLGKRSDLMAMDVNVTSVEFRGNEANADVHFQAKGNTNPGAGMNLTYVLERQGDEWVVKRRAGGSAGANPHGGAASSQEVPGGSTLPPGHPAISGTPGSGAPAAPQPGMPELPQLPPKK